MQSKETETRLFNALLVVLLCLVTVVCALAVLLFLKTANQTPASEAPVVHSTATSTTASGPSQPTTTAKAAEAHPEQELVKGSNHSRAADAYAYKAKDIRARLYDNSVPGKKLVFLTFDDGVNFEVTPKILDVLKEHQVPATFFVIGKTVGPKTQPLLERQIREGHAIGIHSYSHDYAKLYPGGVADVAQVVKEIKATQRSMQEVLGRDFHTAVWRYPGGHMSWKGTEPLDTALREVGVEWMDWNAMCGDAEPITARPSNSSDMMTYLKKTFNVAPDAQVRVVLMHDAADKQLTLEALPQIIEYFKSQGYEFGVLS